MRALHDYECDECNTVHEKIQHYDHRESMCPYCGGKAKRIVSKMRRSQIDIFQEQEFDGLAEGTGKITSKAHLARECEKQGVYSRLLMEGTRNHGRKREL